MHSNSSFNASRRQALSLAVSGLAAVATAVAGRSASAALRQIVVYKTPECGCCGLWSAELRQNGFGVRVIELEDITPIKRQALVPGNLETCHTAFIDRYVIEGHVPVDAIDKLLLEQPDVIGIAVPGMPAGSPGMPSVRREPFDAIAFAADGRQTLFMSFR